ncbi:MAG: bifunctional (p)ppGpp synthetase/guanosine-3',5'-bis(diphosphate) 3'-pyrophosphohydrolase, partial [Sphingomonadales bacterium]
MIRQFELVERVRSYDPHADEQLLNRAYIFSMRAHGSQTRASGDPYFSHPLEVAGILTEMKLDGDTIVTALLHDTVEDTIATIEEIEELFGKKIARLVDGVTKLSRLEIQTESERQAENFRKFLLALSNDIRVLLVKLADRLHNMRTLKHIEDTEKRRRIALETMEIYAPLAERIGMREMKDELEDRAFKELNPEAYESVAQRLQYLRKKGGRISKAIARQIRRTLTKQKIKVEVLGREKTPYSIWKKMERNNITFEDMADLVAFRVIVKDMATCYKTLGIIHRTWAMVPGRFKDYLSTPKRNGYQSIHTTVIGPRKYRIEIQIRTAEMHDVAERGVAAHWSYKQGKDPVEGSQYRWIRELLEILEQASTPEEFLEHTKLEMFQDQVFCFSPKGELISLPRGSTPVDFAYAVHTAIGDSCVGAKVNGRPVPLRHQLANGDQVEILRSRAQNPSPRWESFVVTGRARSALKRYIRKQKRQEYRTLGKSIVDRAFEQQDMEFSRKAIKEALVKLNLASTEDLFEQVGSGILTARRLLKTLFPKKKLKPMRRVVETPVRDWDPEVV